MSPSGLRFVDLFCGAGGFSEGLRQAGMTAVAGNDLDPDACATYGLNFPEAKVLCGDVREPDVRDELLGVAAGVDVIVGGPPCQAFSQVRNHVRLIDDPRNALYREFVRTVDRVEPLAFVMENVQGLEQMGVRQQVTADLSLKDRYRVHSQLLDAADFGVPQTRKRLVFVGLHRDLGVRPPELAGSEASKSVSLERRLQRGTVQYDLIGQSMLAARHIIERLLDPEDDAVVTAEQALGDLRFLAPGSHSDSANASDLLAPTSAYQRKMRGRLCAKISNVAVPRINADTEFRLREIPPGGNYRDLPPHCRQRYISGDRWGPSSGSGLLERKHYYAYRRLHPHIWSWTLNTKADSVYHFAELRALSVREFARLQSFPDDFVFTTDARSGDLPGRIEGGAGHSRYRQAGNAVPPLLARAIAGAIRDVLQSARISSSAA